MDQDEKLEKMKKMFAECLVPDKEKIEKAITEIYKVMEKYEFSQAEGTFLFVNIFTSTIAFLDFDDEGLDSFLANVKEGIKRIRRERREKT